MAKPDISDQGRRRASGTCGCGAQRERMEGPCLATDAAIERHHGLPSAAVQVGLQANRSLMQGLEVNHI